MRRSVVAMAAGLLLAAAGGWFAFDRGPERASQATQPLGLFTSLPILWHEQTDLRDMLASPADRHWAKSVLDQHGQVVALNTLLDLARFRHLIIAQPRPFSPEENVALDEWVRSGGRLLLFADPMLTHDSAFALGDRRRPQDVVLISPILARWGLELRFDEAQPGGLRENAGEAMPVNLPGQFAIKSGGIGARCEIGKEALIARCRVGKGRVLLVADAALLEASDDREPPIARLDALLAENFGN